MNKETTEHVMYCFTKIKELRKQGSLEWENIVKGFMEYLQEREQELEKEVSTSADPHCDLLWWSPASLDGGSKGMPLMSTPKNITKNLPKIIYKWGTKHCLVTEFWCTIDGETNEAMTNKGLTKTIIWKNNEKTSSKPII